MLLLGSRPERRKSRRALWFALLLALPALARAQTEKSVVGRLVGENLVVLGSVGETFVGSGDSKMVTSGSEIRVRSGEARLELARGGLIRICSPAHFTVLGSGDQFTLAVESGRVEAAPSGTTRLAIYTAEIVARPVVIAGEPEEFTLGVEAGGAICIQAAGGAVELEEQLTGKKLVVPQGGEMVLPNGRLAGIREGPGGCRCKLEPAERPPMPPEPAAEAAAGLAAPAGQPGGAEGTRPAALPEEHAELPRPVAPAQRSTAPAPAPSLAPAAQPIANEAFRPAALPGERAELPRPVAPAGRGTALAPPEVSAPVWKVVMPPLVFHAGEPSPPLKPSPEIVQLVLEARVQTALVIRGEVMPQAPQKKRGFWSKFGGFFGHLFGRRSPSRS